jgi:hypothetical protein
MHVSIRFNYFLKVSALVPIALAVACGTSADVRSGDDVDDVNVSALSAGGDWVISDDAHNQMQSFSLPYDDAGADCQGGFTDGAKKLGELVKSRFSSAVDHNEGYACRANTANPSKLSMHAMGRAVDIMMTSEADNGGREAGKEVADFLLMNGDLLGVQFIIWDRTKCNLSQKLCGEYTGPTGHTDHIHVEINEEAASGNAPYYQGTALRDGTAGGSGGGGTPDPMDPDAGGSPDPMDPDVGGSGGGTSGVGDLCTSDNDCPNDQWCSNPIASGTSKGKMRCCTETDPAAECQ